MKKIKKNGMPQILSPDNTMQKVIYANPEGRIDELRKAGKDRIYIVVTQADVPGEPHRIIYLGGHGGDEDAQQSFINTLKTTQ